jgi:ankyrin repeat protein
MKKALTSMVFNPNNRRVVLEILDEVKTGKNKDRDLISDFEHLGNQYRIPENAFANIKQNEELSKLISESRSTLTQRLADAVLKKAAKENAQIKAFYDFLNETPVIEESLKASFDEIAPRLSKADKKALNESITDATRLGLDIAQLLKSNTDLETLTKSVPVLLSGSKLALVYKLRFGEIKDEDFNAKYENGRNLLHELILNDDPRRLEDALKVSARTLNAKDTSGLSVIDYAAINYNEAATEAVEGDTASKAKLERAEKMFMNILNAAIKTDTRLDYKDSVTNLFKLTYLNNPEALGKIPKLINTSEAEIAGTLFSLKPEELYKTALTEKNSIKLAIAIFNGLDSSSLNKAEDRSFIKDIVTADDDLSLTALFGAGLKTSEAEGKNLLKVAADNNSIMSALILIKSGVDAKGFYSTFRDMGEKGKFVVNAILDQADSSPEGRLKWALKQGYNELVPDQLKKHDFKNLALESINKIIEASLTNPEGFKLILNKLDQELVTDVKGTEREDLFKEKYLEILENAQAVTEKVKSNSQNAEIIQLIDGKIKELSPTEPKEEEIIPVVKAEVVSEAPPVANQTNPVNYNNVFNEMRRIENSSPNTNREAPENIFDILMRGGIQITAAMLESLVESSRRMTLEQERQERLEAERKRQAAEEAKRKQEEFNAKIKENTPKVLKGLGIATAIGGTIWGGNELITYNQYKNTDYAGMTHEQRETARPNFELHDAIKLRDPNIVKNTYEKNSYKLDLEYENPSGYNAFHIAVETGVLDTVKFLLDKDSDLINKTNSKNGLTPLHIAALAGNEEVFSYLVEKGADFSLTDSKGKTAKDYLEEKKHENILKRFDGDYFTKKIPESILNETNSDGATKLHELAASSSDESRSLSDYVHSGLEIDTKDNNGRTALFYAVKEGSIDNIRKLIKLGADVSKTDNNGQSLLHTLSESSSSDIKEKIQILLDKGLSINLKDAAGKNALDLAIENKYQSTASHLISAGISLASEVDGLSLLHRAAQNDLGTLIRELIDKGMDVDIRDSDGETPLFKAAENSSSDAINALIEKKANVNAEDNNHETPLFEVNGEENIKALLSAGADPQKIIKNQGKTVMHYMIDKNSSELEIIASHSPEALKYRDSSGETLLHYAAEKNQGDMFKLIWAKTGMNLTETDNNGDTPFHEAAYRGNESVINKMLEIINENSFSKYDILNIRNSQGKTAAELASEQGYNSVAELLRN